MKQFDWRSYKGRIGKAVRSEYSMVEASLYCLAFDIHYKHPTSAKTDAERLIVQTYRFEGTINFMFDIELISEDDFNSYYEFVKHIRWEARDIIASLDMGCDEFDEYNGGIKNEYLK